MKLPDRLVGRRNLSTAWIAAPILLLSIAVASCTGGSTSAVPSSSPSTAASPSSSASIAIGPSASTASLTAGGYLLSLTMPQESTGSTSTVSATISTTLPSGIIAPTSLNRRTPTSLGVVPTTLVYVTLTSTAQVGFAADPSFTFTLPSGTSIPAGDTPYVIFYDPSSYSGGWTALLAPSTSAGSTISFTGVPTGVLLKANTPYVFALAYSASPIPTASPAPTPTPAGKATATPVALASTPALAQAASYCSTLSLPTSGVPLNITDQSGLGATLILYISNGSDFMNQSGAFTETTATAITAIPAACFSNAGGPSNSPTLYLPSGVKGMRVYFAYAPPSTTGTIPNPLNKANVSGPKVTFAVSPYPWDFIELGTVDGATDDTSQVGALGLPLELSVTEALPAVSNCPTGDANVVGVSSCNFATIFTTLAADPNYSKLLITQYFNGGASPIDMRIVAPNQSHGNTSFNWNLLGTTMPAQVPTACSPSPVPTNYLACVLVAYHTSLSNARLFRTDGIGAINPSKDNYCVTSDGTANFIFTDVGPATACANATPNPSPANAGVQPNPFVIPVQQLEYGVNPVPSGQGCTDGLIFAAPWGDGQAGPGAAAGQFGPSPNIFGTDDAFALWKDLTSDFNRGSMLSTQQLHPVGINNPSMSVFWKDPMYNTYAYVIHANFNNNRAYALSYDDLGGWESGLTWHTNDSVNVRINPIPSASAVSAAPVATPEPTTCPPLAPPQVGTVGVSP